MLILTCTYSNCSCLRYIRVGRNGKLKCSFSCSELVSDCYQPQDLRPLVLPFVLPYTLSRNSTLPFFVWIRFVSIVDFSSTEPSSNCSFVFWHCWELRTMTWLTSRVLLFFLENELASTSFCPDAGFSLFRRHHHFNQMQSYFNLLPNPTYVTRDNKTPMLSCLLELRSSKSVVILSVGNPTEPRISTGKWTKVL